MSKKRKQELADARAREGDGTFRADDPTTPEVNEAWKQAATDNGEPLQLPPLTTETEPEQEPEQEPATDTAEAVEPEQPAGVETVETDNDTHLPQDDAGEPAYIVVWHIKHKRLLQPGEEVTGLSADDAARMLASGAIKKRKE